MNPLGDDEKAHDPVGHLQRSLRGTRAAAAHVQTDAELFP